MRQRLQALQESATTPPGQPSLQGVSLLQRLSADERRDLEQRCAFRVVPPGQPVVDRASASGAVFFLVNGTARVVHYVTVVTATGGAANEPREPATEEITIATIGAGD